MPPAAFPSGANVLPLRPRDHENAARSAVTWLAERHRKGWRSASDDWLNQLRGDDADQADAHARLDDDAVQMISINAGEWLLARGEIFAKGRQRNINEYLLGADGPYFTPGQQLWIAQLRARPLRLYRVTDVQPGEGLTLVDELDVAAAPLRVHERSGSRSAHPGLLLGARVMHVDSGALLSGALYPFAALHEAGVLARVRAALDAGLHPQNNLALAERAIAGAWVAQWFEPAPLPELRDAASGDPLLLVTDHYRVLDTAALAAALAAQPDVSGSAVDGWHRDGDAGAGLTRSLAAINPGPSAERIEVFYRTQSFADSGRAWFEALAGTSVQHLTREIVDPRSPAARQHARAGAQAQAPGPGLPPEALEALMSQVLHRHYANWADDTIPALGQQTPRQAIITPAGLERVKGLLRQYATGEAAQAREQGRGVVSFQFLWDALGITR